MPGNVDEHPGAIRRQITHRRAAWPCVIAMVMTACAEADQAALPTAIEVAGGNPWQEPTPPTDTDFVIGDAALAYVDPMIGTGGAGFAYAGMTPAVQVPLGWLRVGPDTTNNGSHPEALHHFSGYYWEDPQIRGFSHTHFVGTGTADYGNLRISFGGDSFDRGLDRLPRDWWIVKTHGSEVAEPGYYAVRSQEGVFAEMTTSDWSAIHRYNVPQGAWMAIDPTASVDDDHVDEASISPPDEDGVLRGRIVYQGDWVGRQNAIEMHFAIEVAPRPAEVHSWDDEPGRQALALRWDGDARVLVRVGVSLQSADNADAHLAQARQTTFAAMRADNRERWAEYLDRIRISGGSHRDRTVFYTALYNCFRMPSRLDEDGVYPGLDGQLHDTPHPYYTDLSLWDTYRTLHPLWTVIAPDETRNALRSLLLMARDGDYIPRWPAALSYTGGMEGDSAAMLFAEAATKGLGGVDYETALELLDATATFVPTGDGYGGRRGVTDYVQRGWIPADLHSAAASNTLEYAVADNAIAELARFVGRADLEEKFAARAQNYENIWDPDTKFFRPRLSDGSFEEPFEPTVYHERSGVFAEGSAWHYRFYATHDPEGLISLFGGQQPFIDELEVFMERARLFEGDRTRLILPDPYYWHTNQPSLHSPFLFGAANRHDRMKHWVDRIMDEGYDTTPDGLIGNDDGGTLSAWYVLAAIGLYPVVGTPRWQTFAPRFDAVRILGKAPAWYDDEPGVRDHLELFDGAAATQ